VIEHDAVAQIARAKELPPFRGLSTGLAVEGSEKLVGQGTSL
jgi:hypothetical protein